MSEKDDTTKIITPLPLTISDWSNIAKLSPSNDSLHLAQGQTCNLRLSSELKKPK